MKRIVVIGSVNLDLVFRTPKMPKPGETILGGSFATHPGGKGANQAVAAARTGGRLCEVHFVGRTGDDAAAGVLLDSLRSAGVNTEAVRRTPGVASGTAMIAVDDGGQNMIVVAPGANAAVTAADVASAESLIAGAAAVVLQLEIPLAATRAAIASARKHGVPVILDPAPVPPGGLPGWAYKVHVFSPNETEAALLLGGRKSAEKSAAEIRRRGAAYAVMKLGGKGALAAGADWVASTPAFKVKAVDTTAAGDAFTGALAVAIATGSPMPAAVRFASAAAAICCTRAGAQEAMPDRAEVMALLKKQR